MRTVTVAAISAAIAAAIAVIAVVALSGHATAKPIRVHGALKIAENCNAAALSYPDISPGSQVTIKGSTGKVIATPTLGAKDAVVTGNNGVGICRYPFRATVAAQARYGITVGTNRGVVWFTAAQMRKGPVLSLTGSGS